MQGTGSGRHELELEVLDGLLPLAREELAELGFPDSRPIGSGAAAFRADGPLARLVPVLGRARLAVAFHLVLGFAVPRPRALLGDQHARRLLAAVSEVARLGGHAGFRFSAAGADSAVFQRLAHTIGKQTGLRHDPDEGELLIRVRPGGSGGWQVLLRLSPRPLSARAWRHCNLEGGLNATIAAAMNRLLLSHAEMPREPVYLNTMCGSGTLLAEWCGLRPRGRAAGLDLSPAALECAARNLAHCSPAPELLPADATAVPWPDASCDFISADPPWGDDIGTHEGNAVLYPAFLDEAARLLRPGGLLVLLSHELTLMQRLLRQGNSSLVTLSELRVWHGGHHPRIWLFRRK